MCRALLPPDGPGRPSTRRKCLDAEAAHDRTSSSCPYMLSSDWLRPADRHPASSSCDALGEPAAHPVLAVVPVEGLVHDHPLRVRGQPAHQPLVEPRHRHAVQLAVALQRDRLQPELGEGGVRRPDDRVDVVEQRAVPVPDDVCGVLPHAVTARRTPVRFPMTDKYPQPLTTQPRSADRPAPPDQVRDLLHPVPEQLVVLGPVHRELGVVVPWSAAPSASAAAATSSSASSASTCTAAAFGQRHRPGDPHLAERRRVQRPVGIGDRGPVRHVDGDHDPAPRGLRVRRRAAAATPAAARLSAAYSSSSMSSETYHSRSAGRDGEGVSGPGPSSPALVRLGETGEGQGDVDAHGGRFRSNSLDSEDCPVSIRAGVPLRAAPASPVPPTRSPSPTPLPRPIPRPRH